MGRQDRMAYRKQGQSMATEASLTVRQQMRMDQARREHKAKFEREWLRLAAKLGHWPTVEELLDDRYPQQ